VEVLPPARQASLPVILGILVLIQLVGVGLTLKVFQYPAGGLADTLNTKRSVILSLIIYSVIAIWGFFINAVLEFWLLAWLVATVQGGSQALSRSLYASMSPRAKSGEFFGFFSVMEKFAGILGPIIFALMVALFGSSRPGILSLIVLFILGGWLLARVNVDEGRRVAQEEDAALLGGG
jgi:UMF1 family MFS transporter